MLNDKSIKPTTKIVEDLCEWWINVSNVVKVTDQVNNQITSFLSVKRHQTKKMSKLTVLLIFAICLLLCVFVSASSPTLDVDESDIESAIATTLGAGAKVKLPKTKIEKCLTLCRQTCAENHRRALRVEKSKCLKQCPSICKGL